MTEHADQPKKYRTTRKLGKPLENWICTPIEKGTIVFEIPGLQEPHDECLVVSRKCPEYIAVFGGTAIELPKNALEEIE